MKAIQLHGDCAATPPRLTVIVDSAIVLPGRPLFLPDFEARWHAELGLAFRIGRLGKAIASKFAPRYVDATAAVVRLVPEGYPDGIGGLFDGALAMGPWLPYDVDAEDMTFELSYDNAPDASQRFTFSTADAAQAVATVSRYATLKQGDLIIPHTATLPNPPAIGQTLIIPGALHLKIR